MFVILSKNDARERCINGTQDGVCKLSSIRSELNLTDNCL